MDRDERLRRLAAVNAAKTFEEEQAALSCAPGVDLRHDLPRDRGKLWRLHTHDMDRDDFEALWVVARRHNLPWERGVRAFYVAAQQVDAVQADLEAEGFIVARGL